MTEMSEIAYRPPSACIALHRPLSLSLSPRSSASACAHSRHYLSRRYRHVSPAFRKCPRVLMDACLLLSARLRPLLYPIGTRWAIQSAVCGISGPGYVGYLGTSATLRTWTTGLRRVFTLWCVLEGAGSTRANRGLRWATHTRYTHSGPLSATFTPNLGCTDNHFLPLPPTSLCTLCTLVSPYGVHCHPILPAPNNQRHQPSTISTTNPPLIHLHHPSAIPSIPPSIHTLPPYKYTTHTPNTSNTTNSTHLPTTHLPPSQTTNPKHQPPPPHKAQRELSFNYSTTFFIATSLNCFACPTLILLLPSRLRGLRAGL